MVMGEALQEKGEGEDGQTGRREWGRLLTMWAEAEAASQARRPSQDTSTPTSPGQAKPPPLPEILLQPRERRSGSRRRESPLASWRSRRWDVGVGGEVVAGVCVGGR